MLRISIVCLLAFAAAGCGRSTPPIHEVTGVVTFKGKPLPLVRLEFIPETPTGPKALRATAITDAQGNFDLTCDDGRRGAIRGKYLVLLSPAAQPNPDRDHDPFEPDDRQSGPRPFVPPLPIPQQYGSLHSTPLRLEIREAGTPLKIELGP